MASISAWKYLIDVVFNGIKEVPIELIVEFRNLANSHQIESYCDYLRGKVLPEYLKDNSWEENWLEDLSKTLPDNIEILVLKGAAARKMNLYSLPLLRQCSDLDIYIHKIKDVKKRQEFIETLAKKNNISFPNNWIKTLNMLETISLNMNNNAVDIHFNLFSPLGNTKSPILGRSRKLNNLENAIVERTVPYNSLKNIKIMSCEDFWFYNVFHFIKNYPLVNVGSILDSHLLLQNKRINFETLLEHAKRTNQVYLYRIGFYVLGQLNSSYKDNFIKPNYLEKRIFKIERIEYANKYSIKSRIISELSKGIIASHGNIFTSFIYGFLYILINNFILSDLETKLTLTSISNSITKIQLIILKFKNLLKGICLKASYTGINDSNKKTQIIHSEKKLISIKLDTMMLTFNVPIEFSNDLERIWKGFLINEHLNKIIEVEKIENNDDVGPSLSVYSNGKVYIKLSETSYGEAILNKNGILCARTFWDVRTFALYLFCIMSLEKEELLLIHAGGVKINGKTFIFPGGSSAGKTTLYNLLTKNGAIGINDDTLLLKKEESTWFVFPTPFMSKNQEPVITEKSKLTGVFDPVKVSGGHELKKVDIKHTQAVILNNTVNDFIIDDSNFLIYKTAKKVIDISKQLLFSAEIKYSIKDRSILFELINKWLKNPNEICSYGSTLIRLVELQGKSMEPTFKEGDILCVEEKLAKEIKPQDIICFSKDPNNFPVVHRVKYIIKHKDSTTMITKGDRCIFEDEPNIFESDKKILKVINKLNLRSSVQD